MTLQVNGKSRAEEVADRAMREFSKRVHAGGMWLGRARAEFEESLPRAASEAAYCGVCSLIIYERVVNLACRHIADEPGYWDARGVREIVEQMESALQSCRSRRGRLGRHMFTANENAQMDSALAALDAHFEALRARC